MREGTEEKGPYRDRNRHGGRERSMEEANGIAGKSVEQQENINTFRSSTALPSVCVCVCVVGCGAGGGGRPVSNC